MAVRQGHTINAWTRWHNPIGGIENKCRIPNKTNSKTLSFRNSAGWSWIYCLQPSLQKGTKRNFQRTQQNDRSDIKKTQIPDSSLDHTDQGGTV